jgi:ElaB/YqjD/DUF883 family membrane-anchored ribosome-binding protein
MKPILQKEKPIEEPHKEAKTFSRAAHAVREQVSDLGHLASHAGTAFSQAFSEAIEDGKVETRRAFKRSRRAAEDLIDETELRIRRAPFISVGIALGAGALVGALIALRFRRDF